MDSIFGRQAGHNQGPMKKSSSAQLPIKARPTKFLFSDATSNDYISDRERFQGKAFEMERANRLQQNYQKQQILQKKRESRLKDYQDRARQVEVEHQKYQQKLVNRASKWTLGMKNYNSAAYNPITLNYDNTDQGKQLKYADDLKNYRHGQRLYNLDTKQNCGYNPITGQPRLLANLPGRPVK